MGLCSAGAPSGFFSRKIQPKTALASLDVNPLFPTSPPQAPAGGMGLGASFACPVVLGCACGLDTRRGAKNADRGSSAVAHGHTARNATTTCCCAPTANATGCQTCADSAPAASTFSTACPGHRIARSQHTHTVQCRLDRLCAHNSPGRRACGGARRNSTCCGSALSRHSARARAHPHSGWRERQPM